MGNSRGNSRRVFTREFKLAAVRELDSGKLAGYVARQLEIKPNLLYRWRRELRKHPQVALRQSLLPLHRSQL
jgi:transposase-like protein